MWMQRTNSRAYKYLRKLSTIIVLFLSLFLIFGCKAWFEPHHLCCEDCFIPWSSSSAVTVQGIPIYGTRIYMTVFTKSHCWTLFWPSWNLIQSLKSYFCKFRYNINLQWRPTHMFSKGGLPFRFSDRKYLCICHFRACYMFRQSQPPWFTHSNNNNSIEFNSVPLFKRLPTASGL
jgi:hypothetical protein